MQVSIEESGELERILKVAVPAERIDEIYKERLRNLSKTAKIKGFRPGKVPERVVKKQFGEQIKREVVNEILQSSFQEAIGEQKLKIAGMPNIEAESEYQEGNALEYKAVFEIFPEFELADLKDQTLEKLEVELTAEDDETILDKLREQRKEWVEEDKAAEEGDRATIDFVGKVDGEPFEGGAAEDHPLVLGSGTFIEGFETGLMGVNAGDKRVLDIIFPDDYPNQELAGKPAQFDVTVKKVEIAKYPEVDEEFAKSFGIEGGIDELMNNMRERMQEEVKRIVKDKMKTAVMDLVLEKNPITLPKSMVSQEIIRLKSQMMQQMQGTGQLENFDLDDQIFAEEANRRVALGLIVAEIIETQKLQAEPTKVRQTIEQLAASYEQPEHVVNWYYSQPERLAEVEGMVLEETVVDWVLDQVQLETKPVSFDELVNAAN